MCFIFQLPMWDRLWLCVTVQASKRLLEFPPFLWFLKQSRPFSCFGWWWSEKGVLQNSQKLIPRNSLISQNLTSNYGQEAKFRIWRIKSKMSWQSYIDDHLMAEIEDNHLSAAAILGHDGSVWAQSTTFPQVFHFFFCCFYLSYDFCFSIQFNFQIFWVLVIFLVVKMLMTWSDLILDINYVRYLFAFY